MKPVKSILFTLTFGSSLFSFAWASNIELTPVLKATSLIAAPDKQHILYDEENIVYSDNEMGLRLNWNIAFNAASGADIHLKNNIRASNYRLNKSYKNSPFRYRDLSYSYINDFNGQLQYDLYQEVDRLLLFTSFDSLSFYAGRQAVSWGLGRFWQPLDIFGAFSPVTLDREYKPGIDALNMEWYPSSFSQINLVYTFTNTNLIDSDNSAAFHLLRQVNERLYLTVVAASLLENTLLGGGLESEVFDAGVRIEAVGFKWDNKWQTTAVLGIEYQFKNEIVLDLEFLYQSAGTNNTSQLTMESFDQLVVLGLQKQLSRSVIGISLHKNLFPLLDFSYVSLISSQTRPQLQISSLQQVNFIYSTSNESDLTLSAMAGIGKKLMNGELQSEFGHIPLSITAQFRYYF